MTEAVTAALIGAGIGALSSILTLFLGFPLALRKEKTQLIWAMEINRIIALEELVGQAVVNIIHYDPGLPDQIDVLPFFSKLHDTVGRFARYRELQSALRDLQNRLGRLIDIRRHFEKEDAAIAEIQCIHRSVLAACDAALKRK